MGEERDPLGNKRFLSSPSHTAHVPSGNQQWSRVSPLHNNPKLLYFSGPGQFKNGAFASCSYNNFPGFKTDPFGPPKGSLAPGGLQRITQSGQQLPGVSVWPGDALNGPVAKVVHADQHPSHAGALHTSCLG